MGNEEPEKSRIEPQPESVRYVAPDRRIVLAKRALELLNWSFRGDTSVEGQLLLGLHTRALVFDLLALLDSFLLDEEPSAGVILTTQQHCESLAALVGRKFPLDQDQDDEVK